MTRRSTRGEVGWYGLAIGQYRPVTPGPVATATRCVSWRNAGSAHSPSHNTPSLRPGGILASRILEPLAYNSTLSAVTQLGPSTRTRTRIASDGGASSPGPYLPLTVISATSPHL